MRKKIVLIGILVVIGALVISAFSWVSISRFNQAQLAQASLARQWNAIANPHTSAVYVDPVRHNSSLTGLSQSSANLARRWNSSANSGVSRSTYTQALTSYSAGDVSAYRFLAMAKFYSYHTR